MNKGLLLILMLFPVLLFSQDLTNTSTLNITKSWSQQPNGYTYPVRIRVPTGAVPSGGFPVCILLHGNGGNGNGMVTQNADILACHVLIAPTGYQNSWNICAENSDAPDVEMVDDLVNLVQGYSNINSNQIRILGSSNGGGLANRVFIENTNSGIDLVCAIVTHLHESQYHSDEFYKPSTSTIESSPFCGYDESTNPLTTRRYLNISNTNDQIIPYTGGASPVGVDFLPAQEAAYIIAQNQGYMGSQLTSGTSMSNPAISEFSYKSGAVVHISGDAGHGTNSTQREYITNFFTDCGIVSGVANSKLDQIKVYPNPTSAVVIVERSTSQAMPYSILNTLGQKIITGLSASESIEINLSDFPSNIYFLKINGLTIRIIKQNQI